jgi:DNA polymerase III subunit alpha
MRYDDGLYFKSHEEMAERFPDRPDVLENTLRIADEVDVEFEKKYYVPAFPLPEERGSPRGGDARDWVWEGAKERYARCPAGADPKAVLAGGAHRVRARGHQQPEARLLGLLPDHRRLHPLGARARGIPVGPGRGSAAGSIVAYCTGITDICPIEFDLLFERFLNPERVSMPDIDVDFCFERRGEVIEYVRRSTAATRWGRSSPSGR